MASRQLTITFLGDAKSAQAAMNAVSDSGGKLQAKLSGLGSAFGNVATVATGFLAANVLGKAPGMLLAAAQGAIEDEAATKRLEQALRNAGGAYDENLAAVNARIDAGQKLAYGDDAIRDSFQQLLAATGDVNESLDRQKLAMDLARGAGIDLETASRMVGKVNEENVDAFRRMGIVIKDGATEAEALAAVQAKFAGQADAYANSTAGQFEQAKIRLGEVQEEIGAKLLPVITKLGIIFLDEVVPAIERFVEVAGPKVEEFARNVKAYWESDIKPAIDGMKKAWEELEPVVVPLLMQIQNTVETAAKVIKLSLGIIVDILGGDFSGAWEKTKELVQTVTDSWKKTIENAAALIRGLLGLFKSLGQDIIFAIRDGAQQWLTSMVIPWFQALPGKLLSAMGNVGQALVQAGKDLVTGFFSGITSAFNAGIGGITAKLNPKNWDVPGWSPMHDAMSHAGRFYGARFGEFFTGGTVDSLTGGAAKIQQAMQKLVAVTGIAQIANAAGEAAAGTSSTGPQFTDQSYRTTIAGKSYDLRYTPYGDAYVNTPNGWMREGNLALNYGGSLGGNSVDDLIARGAITVNIDTVNARTEDEARFAAKTIVQAVRAAGYA